MLEVALLHRVDVALLGLVMDSGAEPAEGFRVLRGELASKRRRAPALAAVIR